MASGHGVPKPNKADHPGRKVGPEDVGPYVQELDAWRASDAAAKSVGQGDYAAYMRSIGMGHQLPKEQGGSR